MYHVYDFMIAAVPIPDGYRVYDALPNIARLHCCLAYIRTLNFRAQPSNLAP